MSHHESLNSTDPHDEASRVRYVTNGRSLFQIVEVIENYGLAGGYFTEIQDCVSGEKHTLDDLNMLALEDVTPKYDSEQDA